MEKSAKRALSCIVNEDASQTAFLPDLMREEVSAMAGLTVIFTNSAQP